MNVIIANKQGPLLETLDIDVIKSVTGCYEANVLVDMFRTFFFNKMVLDITALKDYENINAYKELVSGLETDKIIFFIPENTKLCTAKFLSQLVGIGIYNFTSNIEGIKYLIKHSNTYQEVEYIQKLVEKQEKAEDTTKNTAQQVKPATISEESKKVIGFRNVTSHAGATTLIYMLKKELTSIVGSNKVLAVEINKNDFGVFVDKEMISVSKEKAEQVIKAADKYKIILVDLNDYTDNSICEEIYYLVEPSIIKLNKLIRLDHNVFQKLKGRKLILNKSLLSEKEIANFATEAKIDIFYNMPPLNERKKNEILYEFLEKINLISLNSDKGSRVFGLFRR